MRDGEKKNPHTSVDTCCVVGPSRTAQRSLMAYWGVLNKQNTYLMPTMPRTFSLQFGLWIYNSLTALTAVVLVLWPAGARTATASHWTHWIFHVADAHSDRHQTSVSLSGPVLVLISAQWCSGAAILRGEWKYHLFSVEADFVWGSISINGGRGQLIFPFM